MSIHIGDLPGPHRLSQPACCPTCAHKVHFQWIGSQDWPPEVARAAGLPPRVHLYRCSHCQTTLSHVQLTGQG